MTTNPLLPQQPLGVWAERGASLSLINLALGKIPLETVFSADDMGYNSWHYWAQGPAPHLLWEYLRLTYEHIRDHECAQNGEHPLYRLLARGSTQAAIQWVSEAKWPPDCKKGKDTLWHAVAWSGKTDVLDILSTHFSTHNLNERDEEGLTSAMIAAHRGGRDALMHWMFLGADPNVCDTYGRSILHHVASYGDIGWFTEIQDMGADDNIRNDKNQKPRDVLTDRMRHGTQADIDIAKRHWSKKYQEKIFF